MTKLATRGSTVKFLDFFNWSDSPWAGLTQLRLATTFRLEHYAEDGRFVVRAELFRYGALTRSVELPRRAEIDKITASYDKGILEIVVPLSEVVPTSRRIEITSAS